MRRPKKCAVIELNFGISVWVGPVIVRRVSGAWRAFAESTEVSDPLVGAEVTPGRSATLLTSNCHNQFIIRILIDIMMINEFEDMHLPFVGVGATHPLRVTSTLFPIPHLYLIMMTMMVMVIMVMMTMRVAHQ